jgi:hypothetical protein
MKTNKRRPTAQAEINGQTWENLITNTIKQLKLPYVSQPHRLCTIPMSPMLQALGLGANQYSDGYFPDQHMHVQIKGGDGNKNDGIDKKYLGDLVLLELGYYGLNQDVSLYGDRPHLLYIFAGMKEQSAYTNIFCAVLAEAKKQGKPWASSVHALRFSELTRDAVLTCTEPMLVLV